MDSDITLYRGGNTDKLNELASYTPIKRKAERFGDVTEITIKPKDTYGILGDFSEGEVFIPTKSQLTDLYNQSKPSIKDKVKNSLKSLNDNEGGYVQLPGNDPLESLKQEVTRKKNYDEKPADYVVKYIRDNPEIKYNQQYADAIAKDLGDITPDQKSNLNTEVYLAQQEVRRLKEVERGKKLAQEGYQPLDPSKAKQIIQDAKDRGIKLEVVRKSDGILGTSESKNIYRPSIDADGNPFLMPKNNTRKGYRADDLTGDSPMYYREVGKTTKSVKPTYKDTIPGDEVVGRYRDGKTVKIGNKEYTVHKMSYGQYFAEPKGWQGGERDGFAPGTKWLYGKEDGTFDVVADDDFMRQGVIQRGQQLTDLYNQAHSQPTPKAEAPDPLEAYIKNIRRPIEKELKEAQAELDKYGTGYINDTKRAYEQAKAKFRLDRAKEADWQNSESKLRAKAKSDYDAFKYSLEQLMRAAQGVEYRNKSEPWNKAREEIKSNYITKFKNADDFVADFNTNEGVIPKDIKLAALGDKQYTSKEEIINTLTDFYNEAT